MSSTLALTVVIALILLVILVGCGSGAKVTEFKSARGGFSAIFPVTPKESTSELNTQYGRVLMYMFEAEYKGKAYMVTFADYPGASIGSVAIQKRMDDSRDLGVKSFSGKLIKEKDCTLDSIPGRDLEIDANNALVKERFYWSGNRQYQVMTMQAKDTANREEMDTFLNSFKLSK